MRATNKVARLFMVALVGLSGAAGAQGTAPGSTTGRPETSLPIVECPIDNLVTQLNNDRFPPRLDVNLCNEEQDRKLGQAVVRMLKRYPRSPRAAPFVSSVQSAYRNVQNRQRLESIAALLHAGLDETELEFPLPTQPGSRSPLTPLADRLQALQNPVEPEDPPAREDANR